MAATRWTIRNYNAFLRAARARFDLSLPEARELYRVMRERAGRSLRGVDVIRHPVIAARARAAAVRRARARAQPPRPARAAPPGRAARRTLGEVIERRRRLVRARSLKEFLAAVRSEAELGEEEEIEFQEGIDTPPHPKV